MWTRVCSGSTNSLSSNGCIVGGEGWGEGATLEYLSSSAPACRRNREHQSALNLKRCPLTRPSPQNMFGGEGFRARVRAGCSSRPAGKLSRQRTHEDLLAGRDVFGYLDFDAGVEFGGLGTLGGGRAFHFRCGIDDLQRYRRRQLQCDRSVVDQLHVAAL